MAEVEYEPRDANVRAVAKAGVALGLLVVLGAAASFGAYALVRRQYRDREPAAAPLAQAQGRLPPVPRLQSAPQTDLYQLHAQQLRDLTSYGWVNQPAGTAHIDIEEAMKLYVQRAPARPPAASGAPATLEIPAAAAGPTVTATLPTAAATPSPSPAEPRSHP